MALKNPKERTTPEEWKKVYEENHAIFHDFTEKLQKLIHELLQEHKIDAKIEHRTKSIKSSLMKIQRKGYRNPLEEITDLVGIRIIAYYKEDVDSIGEIIKREFDVDWENSIDKAQTLEPDRFGYLSVQYVISLSSHREKLTEWKAFANIKAEIQVRTILQHAWAVISRKHLYKTAEEVPKNLRRQLFRLSALLELADEEFSNVTMLIEEAKEHYSQDLKKGKLDIELDLTSLDVYLDSTKQHLKWMKIAEEVSYESPEDMLDTSELLEIYFNQLMSDKRKLLKILYLTGIKTVLELDEILKDANKWGKVILTRIETLYSHEGPGILFASPYDVISLLVLYARRGVVDEKIVRQTEFDDALQKVIKELIGIEIEIVF